MRSKCKWLLLLITPFYFCACASPNSNLPLASVDLNRIYGGWYIVATIPNWFEKGMVMPYDVFSRREDGDIKEQFSVKWGGLDAPVKHYEVHDWVRPNTNNAHWRVQLFWPINLPFLVVYVDPQYQYILFGEDNRSLGWIYARSPRIDDSTYAKLLFQFKKLGYDTSKFRKLIQSPDQLGAPGFWSEGVSPPKN